LTFISALTLFLSYRILPAGADPDPDLSLRPARILQEFGKVLSQRQFLLFAIAAGVSSAGMFSYISGSSFTFMEYFDVSEQTFGWIFAFNAAGLIAASQINRFLLNKVSEWNIIRVVAGIQVIAGVALLVGALMGWLNLWSTIALIFIFLAMQGFLFPNTSALCMAPFTRGAGMASATMGFFQMLLSAIASGMVSLFHTGNLVPMTLLMAVCGIVAFLIIFYAVHVTRRVS